MAMLTPTLVGGGNARFPNLLRYHIQSDGAAGGSYTILNAGGGTPDLMTDGWAGAGGALRSYLNRSGLADNPAAHDYMFENGELDICIVPNSGLDVWTIDSTVDGNGRPQLVITAAIANQIAHLTIRYIHTLIR